MWATSPSLTNLSIYMGKAERDGKHFNIKYQFSVGDTIKKTMQSIVGRQNFLFLWEYTVAREGLHEKVTFQ